VKHFVVLEFFHITQRGREEVGSFMLVRRAEGKGINSLFFWTHYFGFFSFWEEKKKIRDLKKIYLLE